jgi:hypothetical protein
MKSCHFQEKGLTGDNKPDSERQTSHVCTYMWNLGGKKPMKVKGGTIREEEAGRRETERGQERVAVCMNIIKEHYTHV